MKRSFRVFMGGLIDYAGLFPPAELDLDTALHNYLQYRREPDAWMLGRFIIPAGRLENLFPQRKNLIDREREPLHLSVLTGIVAKEEELSKILRREAGEIRSFLRGAGAGGAIEVMETRLPIETIEAGRWDRITQYLQTSISILEGSDVRVPDLFVEVPGTPAWKTTDRTAVEGIARTMRFRCGGKKEDHAPLLGLKLRCGPAGPGAFPSVERVARMITACCEAGVPIKCTAGLHHPIRHYEKDAGADSHGFFNIFGAGILACVKKLSIEQIMRCLSDERPDHFSFEEDRFAWRDEAVSLADMKRARRERMISFGSCSFDEPRAHLQALGLLY